MSLQEDNVMWMKRLGFLVWLWPSLVLGNAIIKRFDVGMYRPQLAGVKDLVVDMRISTLVPQLNNKLIFKNLQDVYFRVYFVLGKGSMLEIYGMPKGFNEIKDELIQLAKQRLDFLFPTSLGERYANFTFNSEKSEQSEIVSGVDPQYRENISKLSLYFDKSHRLYKSEIKRPGLSELSTYKYTRKAWSNNKWVLDEMTAMHEVNKNQKSESKFILKYLSVAGFGLPESIEISTRLYLSGQAVGLSQKPTALTFKNYRVNTGDALKYMRTQLR